MDIACFQCTGCGKCKKPTLGVGFRAAPNHQSDVGRIISDGFATIKNFSDWILISSGHARQGKIPDIFFDSNVFKN
jgi:hypothetical protein